MQAWNLIITYLYHDNRIHTAFPPEKRMLSSKSEYDLMRILLQYSLSTL